MIKKHLDKLIKIGQEDIGYLGNNSFYWAKSVIKNKTKIDSSLSQKFDRRDLLAYCNNQKNSNLNVGIAILSWGGMRRDHGRILFNNNFSSLNILITNLRKNKYSTRIKAFDAFQSERSKGNLPGLGIGYFTKLIFFLAPNLNGYIMDQWAGKSINLLAGKQIVSFYNSWVNDKNNAETYDIFCKNIDELAVNLNCSGSEAEERIFSIGNGKGEWRKYLNCNLK